MEHERYAMHRFGAFEPRARAAATGTCRTAMARELLQLEVSVQVEDQIGFKRPLLDPNTVSNSQPHSEKR